MTEIRSIHPNPGGPTHASSPYDRKLDQLKRDIRMLITVAPEEDRAELLLCAGIIDKLLEA